MDPLLPSFRRQLRARAHTLHPVVSIGQHGLTDSVLHEIDVALTAHELIKVRVFNDDRRQRESMLGRIAHALDCAPVQQIGKLLVLWRARPDPKAEDALQSGREPARQTPGLPRRRRTAGAPPATPTGKARARTPAHASSGASRTPRTAGRATTRTPAHASSNPIRTPRIAGKALTRTPAHASSKAPRTPRTAGKAPAGVPRAASRRRRRAP